MKNKREGGGRRGKKDKRIPGKSWNFLILPTMWLGTWTQPGTLGNLLSPSRTWFLPVAT
jgi:hypothetical protein